MLLPLRIGRCDRPLQCAQFMNQVINGFGAHSGCLSNPARNLLCPLRHPCPSLGKGNADDTLIPDIPAAQDKAHAFQALLRHEGPVLFPDVSYSFYPVWCELY